MTTLDEDKNSEYTASGTGKKHFATKMPSSFQPDSMLEAGGLTTGGNNAAYA